MAWDYGDYGDFDDFPDYDVLGTHASFPYRAEKIEFEWTRARKQNREDGKYVPNCSLPRVRFVIMSTEEGEKRLLSWKMGYNFLREQLEDQPLVDTKNDSRSLAYDNFGLVTPLDWNPKECNHLDPWKYVGIWEFDGCEHFPKYHYRSAENMNEDVPCHHGRIGWLLHNICRHCPSDMSNYFRELEEKTAGRGVARQEMPGQS